MVPPPPPTIAVHHLDGETLTRALPSPSRQGQGWRAVLAYACATPYRRAVLIALVERDAQALRRAFARGASPNMRLILGDYPHDTVLSSAVSTDDPGVIEAVLAAGADPELLAGRDMETALCRAVRLRRYRAIGVLTQHGASWSGIGRAELPSHNGTPWVTAAWWAQHYGELERLAVRQSLGYARACAAHERVTGALGLGTPPVPTPSPRVRL